MRSNAGHKWKAQTINPQRLLRRGAVFPCLFITCILAYGASLLAFLSGSQQAPMSTGLPEGGDNRHLSLLRGGALAASSSYPIQSIPNTARDTNTRAVAATSTNDSTKTAARRRWSEVAACPAAVIDSAGRTGYSCTAHIGPDDRPVCCCHLVDRRQATGPGHWPAFTCMPSLVIAGAQKSGTTALVGYLLHHPQVAVGPRKELHVFDKDRLFTGRDDGHMIKPQGFRTLVQGLPDLTVPGPVEPGEQLPRVHKITIDASPSYMLGIDTAARLSSTLPHAVAVSLLRDPVVRAWSEWHMKRRRVEAQVQADDRQAVQPLVTAMRHCVEDAMKPLTDALASGRRDVTKLVGMGAKVHLTAIRADRLAYWWATPRGDGTPARAPRDEAVACLRSIIRGPHLKPIARLGPVVEGATLACLVDATGPTTPGWTERLANTVSGIASKVTGLFTRSSPSSAPSDPTCEMNGACLGPILYRLWPGKGQGQGYEKEAEDNLAACLAAPGRPPGSVRGPPGHEPPALIPQYEALTPWPEVLQGEGTRLGQCSAVLDNEKRTVETVVQLAGIKDVATTGLDATPGPYRAVLVDGHASSQTRRSHGIKAKASACWPDGSSSNIAIDYLYRGVYTLQLARLQSSMGLGRALVFPDTMLRSTPQAVMDTVAEHTGLGPMDVSRLSQEDLDKALDAQFPTFENNGWLLDSSSSSSYQPLSREEDTRLRALYEPHVRALVDWIRATGARAQEQGETMPTYDQLLAAVEAWLPPETSK